MAEKTSAMKPRRKAGHPGFSERFKATSAAVMAACLVGGGAWASNEPPTPADAVRVNTRGASGENGFAEMIAAVKPAVVNIAVTKRASAPDTRDTPHFNMPPGSPFQEYFQQFFGPGANGEPLMPQPEMRGAGSGFIIDRDGYVVTSNHVIENADEINVVLDSGEQYSATLVGRDTKTDIALLKIDAGTPLPYVDFGDSDKARAGDRVLAIGNPFGLGGTATSGIISARGRDIQAGPFDDFIQIDAPINQGNSGGPLFDTQGEVIGINTSIFTPNGGNVGIGFAIPSAQAEPVIAQLRDNGRVDRGWLGVQVQTITPDLAESLGLEDAKGALVSSVVAGSPAASAGLEVGDVILSFGGRSITQMKDLPKLVAGTPSNRRVEMEVRRDGRTRHLQVVTGETQETVATADQTRLSGADDGKLGLTLAPLDGATRQRFELDRNMQGVVVAAVREGSPAAKQGLRPGDVIVRVDRKTVSAPSEVADEVKRAADSRRKTVLFLVERQGDARFVTIDLA